MVLMYNLCPYVSVWLKPVFGCLINKSEFELAYNVCSAFARNHSFSVAAPVLSIPCQLILDRCLIVQFSRPAKTIFV